MEQTTRAQALRPDAWAPPAPTAAPRPTSEQPHTPASLPPSQALDHGTSGCWQPPDLGVSGSPLGSSNIGTLSDLGSHRALLPMPSHLLSPSKGCGRPPAALPRGAPRTWSFWHLGSRLTGRLGSASVTLGLSHVGRAHRPSCTQTRCPFGPGCAGTPSHIPSLASLSAHFMPECLFFFS